MTDRELICIVDSFTDCCGTGGYGGCEYFWDFSERFGPLFTDKEGEPLAIQPGVRTHAFKAFLIWHDELKAEQSKAMRARRIGRL